MGFLINSCPPAAPEKREGGRERGGGAVVGGEVTIPRPRIASHTLKRSLTSSVMRRVIGVVLRGRDLGRDFFSFRFITPREYPRCRESIELQ